MPTTLYRAFNNKNELLYVGVSNNFLSRAFQHQATSKWHGMATQMTLEHFESRAEAEAAEVQAIKTEKPLFNKKDNEDWHNSSTHLTNILGYTDSHHRNLVKAHSEIVEALRPFEIEVSSISIYCYAFQMALALLDSSGNEEVEIGCVSCAKLYHSSFLENQALEVVLAEALGARQGLWHADAIWEATVEAVESCQ